MVMLLLACAFITTDEREDRRDHDGDGEQSLVFGGSDCDDDNPDINTAAIETCNGIDDNCDGERDNVDLNGGTLAYPDTDGDGFGDSQFGVPVCDVVQGMSTEGGDCDDADPRLNPSAQEICSGVDEDCDGLVDDEDPDLAPTSWFADLDHDGFGDPNAAFEGCSPPLGYVDNDLDCNDSVAKIRPGALESCDTQDQDCDGTVDEGAVDQQIFYLDSDGDGWGDESTVLAACTKPAGYSSEEGDCNDSSDNVYPGADESCGTGVDSNCDGNVDTDGDGDGFLACNDCDDRNASINPRATEYCNGYDDDCDGDIDDDDASLSLGSRSNWYRDADSDGYGDPSAVTQRCDASLGTVSNNTDCDDTWAGAHPDLFEVCHDAGDNDCDGSTTDCSHGRGQASGTWGGIIAGDSAGETLWAADYDGDGIVDLAIASPKGDSVYIVYGPSLGGALSGADTFAAANSGDGPGSALHGGDTNADGVTDLLIGAAGGDAVYVLAGPPNAGGSLLSADAVITGSDALGTSVRWINNDGNGFQDAIVSAPETGSTQALNQGSVYLFSGPVSGNLSVSNADATVTGASGESLGGQLAGLDSDGDGQDESALSGDGSAGSSTGSVWLFDTLSGSLETSDADVELSGGTGLLAALANSDIDGDGYQDLLIGDPERGNGQGSIYLILGPINSDASVSGADALISGDVGDGMGSALAIVPDLDGDGIDELWIGGSQGSAAWLFLGDSGLSGSVRSTEAELMFSGSTGSVGASVAAGDVNGDGAPDLITGDTSDGSSKGAVLFLAGGELPF